MNTIIKKNDKINDIIGLDNYFGIRKKLYCYVNNVLKNVICEYENNIETEIYIENMDMDYLDNLYNTSGKTKGFIMLRHVNNELSGRYWKLSYECIRKFYGNIKIVIIDDNSNYDFIDEKYEENLINTEIISTEYKGRGELLPYYYYLKYKFFDVACIIHDSVFVNKYIDFYTNDYIILWNAEHSFANEINEKQILELFKDNKLNIFYALKNVWKVCFGGMTIINYNFLCGVNETYNFEILLNIIKTREDRMCFERVIACLFGIKIEAKKCLFGDILKYCKWGITYDEYVSNKLKFKDLPFIKIWSGR
jgi:hypothetical protein